MERTWVHTRMTMTVNDFPAAISSPKETEGIFNRSFSMAERIFHNRPSTLWYISFTGTQQQYRPTGFQPFE